MGSDFLLAMVEYPKDFDQVRRRIDHMAGINLYLAISNAWGYDQQMIVDSADSEDPVECERWVRSELHHALDLLASPTRDLSIHEVEGKEYAFAGGMSMGDDPSEAWRYICLLQEAYVCYYQDPTGQIA